MPLCCTIFNMIDTVLAEVGQGGTVIDPVIGAKSAQIPVSGVDLDGFHPVSLPFGVP